jgi:hypothetical protein
MSLATFKLAAKLKLLFNKLATVSALFRYKASLLNILVGFEQDSKPVMKIIGMS